MKSKEEELLRQRLDGILREMDSKKRSSLERNSQEDEAKRIEIHEAVSKELRTVVVVSKFRFQVAT